MCIRDRCYIDKLAGELADTMQMCGAHSLAEITPDMVLSLIHILERFVRWFAAGVAGVQLYPVVQNVRCIGKAQGSGGI